MTSSADVVAYSSTINQLSTLAARDLADFLGTIDGARPDLARDALIRVLPEIVDPYAAASSEIAATWYEELRAKAVGGRFYASTVMPVDRSAELVRWGVAPLFETSPATTVLSLIAGGMQRFIADAGRNTIVSNVNRDTAQVGYARIPRPGCCAFCGLLASRGAVYNTSASAGGVVGRGVDASVTKGKRGGQGKGLKARGPRGLGKDKYHDYCHCVAAPVFVGDSFHLATQDEFLKKYDEAGQTDNSGAVDLKATLSEWRKNNSTH